MSNGISAVGKLVGDRPAWGPRAQWLRRSLAVTTLAIGLVGGAQKARADWSPAARVLAQGDFGSAGVAFDAHNTPWVTWSVGPEEGVASSGLFVARLAGHYRLASIHRVPGPYLEEVMSEPAFAIDSAGFGVLAWRYVTEYGFAGRNGAAVTTWPMSGAPSNRIELITPTHNEVGPVSLATNRRGTTIALYSEGGVGRIDAARLSAGKVLAHQQVATVTGGPTALNAQVAPGVAGGFQATWELEGGESEHFAALGADTSHATASGVFSPAQLSPWPAGLVRVSYTTQQLISGPDGDQVAWWTTGPEGAHSPQNLYVASRRPGQSFSAPQFIGQTEYLERPDIVISRAGRFMVAWTQPDGKKLTAAMTATGQVGGKLSTPRLLTTGSNLGRVELVLTQRGEAIVAWWQELASGEVLAQAAASADGTRFTAPHTIFKTTARSKLSCGGASLWADRRDGVLAGWTCSPPGNGLHQFEEFAHYQP
jgi:hypothetical protein